MSKENEISLLAALQPRRYTVELTTDETGSASATIPGVSGYILGVEYVPAVGDERFADGFALAVSGPDFVNMVLVVQPEIGLDHYSWRPTHPVHTAQGGNALPNTAVPAVFAGEDLVIVVNVAGATKQGTVIVTVGSTPPPIAAAPGYAIIELEVSTDENGDGSVYDDRYINGQVMAVVYIPGTLANGATVTIEANSYQIKTASISDGGVQATIPVGLPVIDDKLILTVANGGANKTGLFRVLVEGWLWREMF